MVRSCGRGKNTTNARTESNVAVNSVVQACGAKEKGRKIQVEGFFFFSANLKKKHQKTKRPKWRSPRWSL
jgi:hypothetical protein